MIKNYFIANKNEEIESVIEKILLNEMRTILIVEKRKVIGTISEGDVLKAILYKKKFKYKAESIMNKSFQYLKKKDFNLAKILFLKHNCTLIPVVNNKMLLKDIITIKDFLKKIN